MGQKAGNDGAIKGHRWGSFHLPRGMKGAILILFIKRATAPHFLQQMTDQGAWLGQKGHDWGSFKIHRERVLHSKRYAFSLNFTYQKIVSFIGGIPPTFRKSVTKQNNTHCAWGNALGSKPFYLFYQRIKLISSLENQESCNLLHFLFFSNFFYHNKLCSRNETSIEPNFHI